MLIMLQSPQEVATFLYYQVHAFHTLTMFRACADDINSCRIYAAVTENVGKFGDVLFNAVKHSGKQVAQVVGKDLLRIDICLFA